MTAGNVELREDGAPRASVPLPATTRRPDLELRTQLNLSREVTTTNVVVNCPALAQLAGHQLVTWAGEERPIPVGHVAAQYVRDAWGSVNSTMLDTVKDAPTALFGVPILEVGDEAGHVLRSVRIEARVYHPDCPEEVPFHLMPILPELALLQWVHGHRVRSAKKVMVATSPDRGVLERHLFLRAREKNSADEAFAAFVTLFRHYSINEELCRLDEWMKHLPFTLEEHPGMPRYRELLETQIGHLRGGATKWYAEGSPCAGIDVHYVRYTCTTPGLMPVRLQWLMQECRKEGYKKVAEYGSVEGVNLFHLIQLVPDIEWHGFEVNATAVRRGHELASEAGLPARGIHLNLSALNSLPTFKHQHDAVALFEVLEHNSEEEGAGVLREAESLVRPGGEVFITTPCGNWSAHDDKTQVVALRKDHVNAYTPARMREFLTRHSRMVPRTLEVRRVDNPSLHENNAWVFARYRLPG